MRVSINKRRQNREFGGFFLNWLIGVAIGAALVGGGLLFGIDYLHDEGKPVASHPETPSGPSTDSGAEQVRVRHDPRSSLALTPPAAGTSTPHVDAEGAVDPSAPNSVMPPPRSAAPVPPAYVRLDDGRVVAVPDDQSIDDVIEVGADYRDMPVTDDAAYDEGFDDAFDDEILDDDLIGGDELDEDVDFDDEADSQSARLDEQADYESAEAERVAAFKKREQRAASESQKRLDELRGDDLLQSDDLSDDDGGYIAPRVPD